MADPSGSLPANITLYPTLKYDPRKDLAPVAIVGTTGAAVTVPASSPVKTLKELVELGKQKPGELTYVSVGNGTPGHLNGEMFSRLVGIKAVHVPYRVMSQAVTDMIAGRVSFWIVPIPGLLQQINAGQVRALAVAGDARSRDLPGVPTVEETGFGHFDASTTYALFGPAGTPTDIVDKMHEAISKALEFRRGAAEAAYRRGRAEDRIARPGQGHARGADPAMGRGDQERRNQGRGAVRRRRSGAATPCPTSSRSTSAARSRTWSPATSRAARSRSPRARPPTAISAPRSSTASARRGSTRARRASSSTARPSSSMRCCSAPGRRRRSSRPKASATSWKSAAATARSRSTCASGASRR